MFLPVLLCSTVLQVWKVVDGGGLIDGVAVMMMPTAAITRN